jgi:hypothetical protein
MNPEERATGTRDEEYNLVSVLYHALHGAENCQVYATDAEATGDADLAAFFRNAQAMQGRLAEQAKERLGLGGVTTTPGTAEVGTTIPPEGVTGPEVPPTPRDVRRGTSPGL